MTTDKNEKKKNWNYEFVIRHGLVMRLNELESAGNIIHSVVLDSKTNEVDSHYFYIFFYRYI